MGLWGTFTTSFKGKPHAPGAIPYSEDTYFGEKGVGTAHGRGMDEAAYGLLQKYLAREPGYTPEEQRTMYEQPAEQTKLQEQGALRRINQGTAGAGSFGSGGRVRSGSSIIEGGIRTRAGLKQNVIVQAAEAAMQDRIRQIQAAEDYSTNRLGSTSANVSGRNAYNMGVNQFNLAQWQSRLEQYNYERKQSEAMIQKMITAGVAGCWVADELFGVDTHEANLARYYVNQLAPVEFRAWYLTYGEQLAGMVHEDPDLADVIRPLFVLFIEAARKDLGDDIGRVHAGADGEAAESLLSDV